MAFERYPTGKHFEQIMAIGESPERDREIFRYIAELQEQVNNLENKLEKMELKVKETEVIKNEIMNLSFIKKIKEDSYRKGFNDEIDSHRLDNAVFSGGF